MVPLSFSYHDINEAYCEMQTIQHHYTQVEETRNGKARVFKAPVTLQHTNPARRVLFDPVRDANPFFHYMEAIWMLSGEDNVDFPATFAKNIRNYSDDGQVLRGAYGYRWRKHFLRDQINIVVDILQHDPTSRRAAIAMWDPNFDLGVNSKDLPCNTHLYFKREGNKLHMTICNRSNDMVWGMLGANIVHFNILQEYIAGALQCQLGNLFQFTNNLHIYDGFESKFTLSADRWYQKNQGYRSWRFTPDNLSIEEAQRWVHFDPHGYNSRIITRNAKPMLAAWSNYKCKDFDRAIAEAGTIYDEDWRHACIKWLERRQNEAR